MNPVDRWLAINAKYFPTEQVQYIRQRLEALPEQQLSMLYSISFQDPTMMLVISLLVVLLESTALFWDKLVLVLVNFDMWWMWYLVNRWLVPYHGCYSPIKRSKTICSYWLMKNYFTRLWAYHQRFFRLYLLVLVAVYGVYLLHLPTPLSLILRPFGLNGWSAGLTRASVRLYT